MERKKYISLLGLLFGNLVLKISINFYRIYIGDFYWIVVLYLIMSYAQAAGAGSQNGSDKYFSRNMVVCFANGIEYEALAKVLNEKVYWKDVIGYQRVDVN